MCVSCSCGSPEDDHGDSRNITKYQLEQAAVAAGISLTKLAENIAAEVPNDAEATEEQVA